MEKISVIIPCYRQAEYLPEAIKSVQDQAGADYEIIVVDDGTPGDSVLEVARRYDGVRYVKQTNGGAGAARNRGLKESDGRYVLFLDGDDRLLPSHFRTSLLAFQEHPGVACVFGTFRVFGGSVEEPILHDCRPNPDHYAILLRRNFIGTLAGVLFQRQIVEQVGGFRLDVNGCEDYELLLRVVRQYPVHCHHHVVAEYRRHHGQLSSHLGLMLRSNLHVAWLQRPYIAANSDYQEAYRHGVSRWRLVYGEPLVWETVRLAKDGNWSAVYRNLSILLRYHPRGFLNLIKAKLGKLQLMTPRRRVRARL
jgi:glycosyltransferase involved in cell wall biosynthesis